MKSIVLALIGAFGMTTSGTNETTVNVETNVETRAPLVRVAARVPLECVPVTDRTGCCSNACYTVNRFVNRNGAIWAVCKLRGTIDGILCEEDCEVPVIIDDCSPSPLVSDEAVRDVCTRVSFGSCSIARVSCSLELDPTETSCTSADYPSELISGINRACKTIGMPVDQVVILLNQLL